MLEIFIAVACVLLGLYLQRRPNFPIKAASTWVNNYLFYIVLPALALLYIPKIEADWQLLIPISAAWFTFLLSWLIFGLLGHYLSWGKPMTGCLIIVAGLANTSFMGFPIIEFFWGTEGLSTALLIDQGGSYLLVSSLSVVVGTLYSEKEGDLKKIPWKIISFPPFLFLMIAVGMSILKIPTPDFLLPLLGGIGKTMAPIALLAISLKFNWEPQSLRSRFFWMGMGYRLLLAPLIIWLVYQFFLPKESLELRVTVLESGMAPMITGSIVAINFDLNPKLASQLSGLGMPISLLTLFIWYFLLRA